MYNITYYFKYFFFFFNFINLRIHKNFYISIKNFMERIHNSTQNILVIPQVFVVYEEFVLV